MLSIFNRREPIRIFPLKKQEEIREIDIHQTPYFTRMVAAAFQPFPSAPGGAEELWMRIWLRSMNTPSSSKKTAMRRHWGSLAGFFSRWESVLRFSSLPGLFPLPCARKYALSRYLMEESHEKMVCRGI